MTDGPALQFPLTAHHMIALWHVKDGADIVSDRMAALILDLQERGLVETCEPFGLPDTRTDSNSAPARMFGARLTDQGRELLGIEPDECGWLCLECGNWNDDELDCDDCGAEPPQGCTDDSCEHNMPGAA